MDGERDKGHFKPLMVSMLRQRRWMLVGAVTALHSPFDSLMSDNTREVKEVTGQMTSRRN